MKPRLTVNQMQILWQMVIGNEEQDFVEGNGTDEMMECDTDKTEQVLEYIGGITQKRLPCCIHTIQLVVVDGLKTAKFMGWEQLWDGRGVLLN
jgi:hypothetical protein